MKKYLKKPRIVEAEQFLYCSEPYPKCVKWERGEPFVVTIHGQQAWLNDADWVVTEPDGIHHYPVRDDIFRRDFEEAP